MVAEISSFLACPWALRGAVRQVLPVTQFYIFASICIINVRENFWRYVSKFHDLVSYKTSQSNFSDSLCIYLVENKYVSNDISGYYSGVYFGCGLWVITLCGPFILLWTTFCDP
jgi:glutathionyl-hydroquinone reductase